MSNLPSIGIYTHLTIEELRRLPMDRFAKMYHSFTGMYVAASQLYALERDNEEYRAWKEILEKQAPVFIQRGKEIIDEGIENGIWKPTFGEDELGNYYCPKESEINLLTLKELQYVIKQSEKLHEVAVNAGKEKLARKVAEDLVRYKNTLLLKQLIDGNNT